jgi:hypothetical protein
MEKIETAQENGHIEWKEFDDDSALLRHISLKKPAEKLVPIPEWETKILCIALPPETRIKLQLAAYNEETKRTDFRSAPLFVAVIMAGCYNPVTRKHFFPESYRATLIKEGDGSIVDRLAIAVLRLSGMISDPDDETKKN